MTISVSRCKSLLTSDLRLHVIVGLAAYRLQFILCKYIHILHDYTLYISTCTWLYKWFICNFPALKPRWFLSCATKVTILEGTKSRYTLLRQLRPQPTLSLSARTIPACSYLITHTLLPVVEHSSRPYIQANCSELYIQQHRGHFNCRAYVQLSHAVRCSFATRQHTCTIRAFMTLAQRV